MSADCSSSFLTTVESTHWPLTPPRLFWQWSKLNKLLGNQWQSFYVCIRRANIVCKIFRLRKFSRITNIKVFNLDIRVDAKGKHVIKGLKKNGITWWWSQQIIYDSLLGMVISLGEKQYFWESCGNFRKWQVVTTAICYNSL